MSLSLYIYIHKYIYVYIYIYESLLPRAAALAFRSAETLIRVRLCASWGFLAFKTSKAELE